MFPKKIHSTKISAQNSKNNTQSHSMYRGQNTDLDFKDDEEAKLQQQINENLEGSENHSDQNE